MIILVGLSLWPVQPGPAFAENMAWTNDQAMLIFFETVTKIKKHSLDSPDAGQITTAALKAYMNRHDPYGDYLSPEEYRQWKQSQKYSYYGIGMEIIDRSGHFYCLPRPTSPAETAGIKQGDELLAVNDDRVEGRSIYWVGSRIRGEKNSLVKLTVSNRNIQHKFNINRRPLKDISVWLSTSGQLDILQISHFSSQTFEEIKTILQKHKPDRPLVLDLRNNPGGDLFAAVDIAGLFLPAGSKILMVQTNKEKLTYTAKGRIWKGKRIALWQNEFTASASEILIAGLVANNMAVTFGSASYGKAMTQNVVELSDGSALIISRGRLTDPNNNSWQTQGLAPMFKIKDSATSWAGITLSHLNIEGEQ
ncbi:MAG: S41 family peptidase [Pseudomonadota bacterium]